jgi:hypothetical protein
MYIDTLQCQQRYESVPYNVVTYVTKCVQTSVVSLWHYNNESNAVDLEEADDAHLSENNRRNFVMIVPLVCYVVC